jgi:hypothetical protein
VCQIREDIYHELMAVEQLWPEVPHQVCQFHVLRDAAV